mmetsp:Transcript_979/g.2775  ORF Transcript_979/g.2775 Transcript_979/m.2775 type:complete len:83 (-) Transcript_979:99-347(-)|eukprot:CAMPEP_0185839684 /NCGR_PEP_ID=MMETSP1353-20130828/14988_1 /TAXON_ID=1077150 /ORGANISM="Erythrolobus australicus, Strain CCMP3124" /LENGTH=82 /DNA_ID=CAMNT_0028538895 /DNA_START=222 /DNA_END=470 /DNA_ORIENTATION=-
MWNKVRGSRAMCEAGSDESASSTEQATAQISAANIKMLSAKIMYETKMFCASFVYAAPSPDKHEAEHPMQHDTYNVPTVFFL